MAIEVNFDNKNAKYVETLKQDLDINTEPKQISVLAEEEKVFRDSMTDEMCFINDKASPVGLYLDDLEVYLIGQIVDSNFHAFELIESYRTLEGVKGTKFFFGPNSNSSVLRMENVIDCSYSLYEESSGVIVRVLGSSPRLKTCPSWNANTKSSGIETSFDFNSGGPKECTLSIVNRSPNGSIWIASFLSLKNITCYGEFGQRENKRSGIETISFDSQSMLYWECIS